MEWRTQESKEDILRLLKDFHQVSGFRVSIHSADLTERYGYPEQATPFCAALQKNAAVREECLNQDNMALNEAKRTGKPHVYECHCGLLEAVVPIYHFGILSGFLMMGQVAVHTPNVHDRVEKACGTYFESQKLLENALKKLVTVPRENCESFLSLMVVLAEYLTGKNMIMPEKSDLAFATMAYIDRHYAEDLSLFNLCEEMRCSKSTLMNAFRNRYKKSVGDAIREVRLKNAMRRLLDSDESVKKVAIACGFLDQNYFAKVFRANFGMSPSEWRKINKDGQ